MPSSAGVSSFASALQIPAIVWHAVPRHGPSTAIAADHSSSTGDVVATGDVHGRVVIWKEQPDLRKPASPSGTAPEQSYRLVPCTISLGHASPIVSLDFGAHDWGKPVLLSCDESGKLVLWSASSGHCLKSRSFRPRLDRHSLYTTSAQHSAVAAARFFSDRRHALMVHRNGGLEVVDTWTMKLVVDLPHNNHRWGHDWHVSAIPFDMSKDEHMLISTVTRNQHAFKGSANGNDPVSTPTTPAHASLPTRNISTTATAVTEDTMMAFISTTSAGVVTLWSVLARRRTRIARSGIRGTGTDNLGKALHVCSTAPHQCLLMPSSSSAADQATHHFNTRPQIRWVAVLHEKGCRVLALQRTGFLRGGMASLAFVEYHRIGAPSPHASMRDRPVWSSITVLSVHQEQRQKHSPGLVRPSGSKTATAVQHNILITDSTSRCACIQIPDSTADAKFRAAPHDTGIAHHLSKDRTEEDVELTWAYLPEETESLESQIRRVLAPVVYSQKGRHIFRVLDGTITSWSLSGSRGSGQGLPVVLDVARFSRGFQGANFDGTEYGHSTSPNSAKKTSLTDSTGGLLLHWERGAATPALAHCAMPNLHRDIMAPIIVRMIDRGQRLQFTTTCSNNADSKSVPIILPVLETEWGARRRQRLALAQQKSEEKGRGSDERCVRATCLASLRSRRYGRWLALQTGIIDVNSGSRLGGLADDEVTSPPATVPDKAQRRVNSSNPYMPEPRRRPEAQYHVLVGCEDGSIRVCSVAGKRSPPFVFATQVRTLQAHNGPVRQIYVQDNRAPQSLSSSRQSFGRDYTAAGRAEALRVRHAIGAGVLVSNLDDDIMFCSAGQDDGIVCVFALTEANGVLAVEPIHCLSGHMSPVLDVQWDAAAGFTFCSMACGDTCVWNTTVGTLERTLPTSQLKHLLLGGNNEQATGGGEIGGGAHFTTGDGFDWEDSSWLNILRDSEISLDRAEMGGMGAGEGDKERGTINGGQEKNAPSKTTATAGRGGAMSEAAAAGERGGARAAQSGQRLTGDGRDGVGRDIDEGSVDLYSGKRCGWRISQGCDSAHPFLSGKDPQTISGIDATYGGDSGFFGTGSNNEWKADGHWSITPFTLQDFQKTRRDASALESGSDGSETRAGEWNRPESPIPRTPTRRSNPRGKSQSSEMFVSAGDHRVGSSGSRRNSASPKGAFSFSKYGMRSTAAQIYASTGAIRTRRVPASLQRIGHPYNSSLPVSPASRTEGPPLGDILHMSIPGLVERAEMWLRAKYLVIPKINRGLDDDTNNFPNPTSWSEDRDLGLISLLLAWGIDQDLDDNCTASLGLERISLIDPGAFSLGTYGCEGTMTFACPTELQGERRFSASPELNALHRLALVTFFMSLMPVAEQLQKSAQDYEESSMIGEVGGKLQLFFSKMITHYGIVFPDRFSSKNLRRPSFAREDVLQRNETETTQETMREEVPSLGLLAHFAVGSWETASVGARLLLQAIIERMPESTRKSISTKWANKLHEMRENTGTLMRTNSRTPVEDGRTASNKHNLPMLSPVSSQITSRGQKTVSNLDAGASHLGDFSPGSSSDNGNGGGDHGETADVSSTKSSPGRITIKGKKFPDFLESSYNNTIDEAKFVLVLGMIGVTYPQDLSPATASAVTSVFLWHTFNGTPSFSTVAMELMGKGFPLWRPHIGDVPRLLRHLLETIFRNSIRLERLRRRENAAAQTSLEASMQMNSVTTSSPSAASSSSISTTLNMRTARLQAAAAAAASAVAAARHALMEAGSAQPLLFLSSVGKEVTRQDMGSMYHRTCLDCIIQLVRDNSVQMVRHLPVVVEAVIRPLYPGEPVLRKMCLVGSTMALHDLVKRFPMVAFHQPTQRLACGTTKGRIVLYDLRTATKWRILENSEAELQGGISVVAFNREGSVLASYSAEDACICTWTAGSGGFLGGILGMQGRRKQKINLNKRQDVTATLEGVMQHCRLQFGSLQARSNRLKLRREDGQIVTVGLK